MRAQVDAREPDDDRDERARRSAAPRAPRAAGRRGAARPRPRPSRRRRPRGQTDMRSRLRRRAGRAGAGAPNAALRDVHAGVGEGDAAEQREPLEPMPSPISTSFVFFGYLVAIDPVTELTAGDRRGVRWSDALETPWLTDLAKVADAARLAAGRRRRAASSTALVLIWRRHGLEGLALLGGLALTYAGVHVAKAAMARPRPLDPLVDAGGFAYPSGHAAYAVCWVAVAVALRHAFPRLAVQAGLLIAGFGDRGRCRAHAHLPARALVLRRRRRLGAGRDVLRARRDGRAGGRLSAQRRAGGGARQRPLTVRRSSSPQTTASTAATKGQKPPITPAIASTMPTTAISAEAARREHEAVGALLARSAREAGGGAAFEISHQRIIARRSDCPRRASLRQPLLIAVAWRTRSR